MSPRIMHVRMPAETSAALRANRQRETLLPRVAELVADHKVGPFAKRARVVALVGSCRRRNDGSTWDDGGPARLVYNAPLFRKSLELAELVGDATFVVSPAKMLIQPGTLITPREIELYRDRHDADVWAAEVLRQLENYMLSSHPSVQLVLFMGARMAAPLLRAVADERKRTSTYLEPKVPMHGIKMRDRLSYLTATLRYIRGVK